MRRGLPLLLTAALVLLPSGCGDDDESPRKLILATTTSTQDSGLLDDLLPAFTRDTGWEVTTLAVGSGQAIELGRRGEADVLLVHSPTAEEELVAEGTTGRRLLVMHNDFLIVGPPDDPAQIGERNPPDALTAIAEGEVPFISRGDESGTHAKEKSIWAKAGIAPEGSWYSSTGQGMSATLQVAAERNAYTLTDRATFLSQRDTVDLVELGAGGPELLNVYHVIELTERAGDRVQTDGAAAFADWIVSATAQELIGRFGVDTYGEALFTPDAGRDEDELAA
ncbi:substrate-binding domain-containing protein [Sporichthya polymorpha]|uniref:substrate-binding domain-containing protein n=1 Tax=Sporichthya polymorpha TaxID=35751 RepID=UPI000370BE59|nr:substrate-binding domain-containing protein [Sporichthya polymorpha]